MSFIEDAKFEEMPQKTKIRELLTLSNSNLDEGY
jgi:hypothetical protein